MDAQGLEAPVEAITRTVQVKVVKEKRKVDACVSASDSEVFGSKMSKRGPSQERFKGRQVIS
jgi:hypothetical protein